MEKQTILIFVMTALMGGAIFSMAYFGGGVLDSKEKDRLSIFAVLEGIPQESSLTYTFRDRDSKVIAEKRESVKNKGNIALLQPAELIGADQYEVSINVQTANKQLVDFDLNVNRQKALVSLNAKGILPEEYVSSSKHEKKYYPDWAGQLKIDEYLGRFQDNKDAKSEGPVTFAFYNQSVLDVAEQKNPMVLKVLDAPGGGGPGDDGVNDYELTWCQGNPSISVCDEARLRRQNRWIVENYVTSIIMMAEELSADMFQYVGIIGSALDAKMQMETQRKMRVLTAEAHRDYHPSDQMCRFGSFVKSIAESEQKANVNAQAISQTLAANYLNTVYTTGAEKNANYLFARLEQFRTIYCDRWDNGGNLQSELTAENNQNFRGGLAYLCQWDQGPDEREIEDGEAVGALNVGDVNKDIDYTRTIEYPLTLDIDFDNDVLSEQEEDVIAMARNLYWPDGFDSEVDVAEYRDRYDRHMTQRRDLAALSVAHNSFAHYVAEKGKSSAPEGGESPPGYAFMKALMREFGISTDEITEILGENPSYFAQMEVLTSKAYESPHFYTNLYDKPANVDRINVALDAIKLMQMRDMHDASLRMEMLNSVWLSKELEDDVANYNSLARHWIADESLVPYD